MTKKKKLASLTTAMTRSTRRPGDDDEYYDHFTGSAPKELKDLFLEYYEVQDIDYEIFSQACDSVSESYAEYPNQTDDEAEEDIYERAGGSASMYVMEQIDYIDMRNQDEIADYVRELGSDIGTAAAYWYDKQVEIAATRVKDWVNEK